MALKQSSGIEEFGEPKWDLVLCLMFAWIICFLCLIKGIKSTGKVWHVYEIKRFLQIIWLRRKINMSDINRKLLGLFIWDFYFSYMYIVLATLIVHFGRSCVFFRTVNSLLITFHFCLFCHLQVVYFTAVFPYIVLLILFFNGVFLSNAGEGIYFYVVPDFSRLLDPGVGEKR